MTRDFEPVRRVPGVNETSLSPSQVKERIRNLDPLERNTIDTLIFGKPCTALERELFAPEDYDTVLEARYPGEKPWKGFQEMIWTPYDKIKSFIGAVGLSRDSTFYDLGAGYGRVPLYAGITTEATCKGIELVRERAEVAQAAKARLQLDNVEIINANVLDVDFSDGDVFYLFSPFSSETFSKVIARLQQIASQKPLTVVARAAFIRFDSVKELMRTNSLWFGDRKIAIYTSSLHPPPESIS